MRTILFIVLMVTLLFSEVVNFGLFIGSNQGLINEEPLTYANRDAQQIHAIMTTLGDIEKDRTYLLLDQSIEAIEGTFREIIGRAKELKRLNKEVMLFLYFSGHGSPGYLHLRGKKYSLDHIKEFFHTVDADLKMLVADACFSGTLLSQKGGRVVPTPMKIDIEEELNAKGTILITSSSGSEQAHESATFKGSVFTFHLANGLRGAADFDKSGEISVWEAMTYARVHTTKTGQFANVEQHPGFDIDLSGTREVILSRLAKGATTITLAECMEGEYSIFDEPSMTLQARFKGERGDSVILALPPNRYIVKQVKEDRLLLASVDMVWGKSKRVTKDSFKPYPIDAFAKKGNTLSIRNNRIAFSCNIMSGIDKNTWVMPQCSYAYSFFKSELSVHAGFCKDKLLGNALTIDRLVIDVGSTFLYHLVNKSRFTLSCGPRLDYLFLRQSPIRSREDDIQGVGYDAIASYIGHLAGGAFGGSASLHLPAGITFQMQLFPGIIVYRDFAQTIQGSFNAISTVSLVKLF